MQGITGTLSRESSLVVPNARSRLTGRLSSVGFLVLCLAACRTDAPTAAGTAAMLERVSGDGQTVPPGGSLERPLVARIVDADGRPVRRVEVRWTVTSGEVTPNVSATDANGQARAVWRLGTESGAQRASASADGLEPVEFVAFVDPSALADEIPLRALDLETYEGSGQVVHPDVAFPMFDGAPGGARLAIT